MKHIGGSFSPAASAWLMALRYVCRPGVVIHWKEKIWKCQVFSPILKWSILLKINSIEGIRRLTGQWRRSWKILERSKKTFAYFRPSLVYTLDPDGNSSRTGNCIRKLISKIVAYADEEKLPVVQYSRDQIRDIFEPFGVVRLHLRLKLV